MSFSPRLIFRLAVLVLAFQVNAPAAPNPTRLMVDLSAKPDAVMLSAFDLCIVDNDAKVDLEAQQSLGNRMLARVDLLEIRQNSAAARAASSVGIPLLAGTRPGHVRLDATHPHWVPLVVYEIVQDAAEKGFDGFVLTGLETLSQDAERAACLQVIAELHRVYPDKQLVIEGALDLAAESRLALDAVLFLSGNEPGRDQQLREVKRLGLLPLVVEYAAPDITPQEIATRTQHFRALGAVPFFTTPDLAGLHLGPLQEVTRQVLVIHSGPAHESFTARVLQGSLEWLGYQVRYWQPPATDRLDWKSQAAQTSAVIVDASLQPQPSHQAGLLALATHLKEQHLPLLLTAAPWGNADEFTAWAHLLGLRGSGQSMTVEKGAVIREIEHAWLQESGAVRPRTRGFRDLQAPAGARVLLSIKAGAQFDQAFLAHWGGVWMDAQAAEAGPQLQPIPFLNVWLGKAAQAPVMDMTSQNGRRLMVPIISSEGFTRQTSLQGLPTAAEAMTERILSRYSLPFTAAVCEGDLRRTNPGLDARDSLRHEAAARDLFALPQVHAASASRTRPADWATSKEMEREIAGSMAYIHRHLLPPGSQVELMLWPEASTPTPAAIAFSRRMGVENMQPVQPARWLARTAPPAALMWGQGESLRPLAPGHRQVGPLNASEFIFEAEAADQQRWLAPLHVPLSFEDATSEASLWEVERVLDWCASRPLHAMSAAHHARLVRDAAQTRIFAQGSDHWIIVNAGHARTLRLPASSGIPDLNRCIGIVGYTVRGDDLYIHTQGRRRTEVVLSADGSPDHLRLASSSGSVRYLESGHRRALIQVADLRPVELAFEGIQPGAVCQIFTTEQPQFIMADAQGRVEVTVPAQSTFRLQVLPPQQAAMR